MGGCGCGRAGGRWVGGMGELGVDGGCGYGRGCVLVGLLARPCEGVCKQHFPDQSHIAPAFKSRLCYTLSIHILRLCVSMFDLNAL